MSNILPFPISNHENVSGKYYCLLIKNEISSGKCLDINYELTNIIKEDLMKGIKMTLNMNRDEMETICLCCPYYPLKYE